MQSHAVIRSKPSVGWKLSAVMARKRIGLANPATAAVARACLIDSSSGSRPVTSALGKSLAMATQTRPAGPRTRTDRNRPSPWYEAPDLSLGWLGRPRNATRWLILLWARAVPRPVGGQAEGMHSGLLLLSLT